jgi:DNA invertase Pin-like site-specific DNA recombinase
VLSRYGWDGQPQAHRDVADIGDPQSFQCLWLMLAVSLLHNIGCRFRRKIDHLRDGISGLISGRVFRGRPVLIVRLRNKCLTLIVKPSVRQQDSDTQGSNSRARVGYTRVSTVAQTLEQQDTALSAAGVIKTFSDTMSGARDDRPGLAALLDYVREGDTVVVWKLDRLGRNTLHILETVKALTDRSITLISTTDGIDSSTAAGRMVIGVLASMAEFERELVKERTALKRAVSRANGARFGRPKKVVDREHMTAATRMKADGHTAKDVAKYLGVSRATLYRYLANEGAASA